MSTYSRDEVTRLVNADSSKMVESPTLPPISSTSYPTYSPHEAFSLVEGQGILQRVTSPKRSHSPLEEEEEDRAISFSKKKKGSKRR